MRFPLYNQLFLLNGLPFAQQFSKADHVKNLGKLGENGIFSKILLLKEIIITAIDRKRQIRYSIIIKLLQNMLFCSCSYVTR